jgi:hypothetical protein
MEVEASASWLAFMANKKPSELTELQATPHHFARQTRKNPRRAKEGGEALASGISWTLDQRFCGDESITSRKH